MEKSKTKLFSYVCPSCGGHLETDDNRKLMVCISCGNTYDYDYFCEENLLLAADKALANSDFSSAGDMYSFMLDKEPSNVKALTGLILSNNKVKKLYDITLKIKNGTFIPGTFNLKKYREKCDAEDLHFFEQTDKILSLYKEYNELKNAMKQLETEENSTEQKFDKGDSESLFYYEGNDKLKKIVIAASVILLVLGITAVAFGTEYGTPPLLIAILVIAMIGTVITILAALWKMRDNKKEQKSPVSTKLDEIDAKMEDNKVEMHRVISEINAVFKEMNNSL